MSWTTITFNVPTMLAWALYLLTLAALGVAFGLLLGYARRRWWPHKQPADVPRGTAHASGAWSRACSWIPPKDRDAPQPSAKSVVTELEREVCGVPVPHMEFDPELVYRLLMGCATLPSKDEQQRKQLNVVLTYLKTLGPVVGAGCSPRTLDDVLAALRTYWWDQFDNGMSGAEPHMQQIGGQMHAINALRCKKREQT